MILSFTLRVKEIKMHIHKNIIIKAKYLSLRKGNIKDISNSGNVYETNLNASKYQYIFTFFSVVNFAEERI